MPPPVHMKKRGQSSFSHQGSSRTPHIDFYTGERPAMCGTASGGEASRISTYRVGRAGPAREHVRRGPVSGDAVSFSVERFEEPCCAHAAADAHGDDGALASAAPQLVEGRRGELGAGATEGVA